MKIKKREKEMAEKRICARMISYVRGEEASGQQVSRKSRQKKITTCARSLTAFSPPRSLFSFI